MPPSTRVVVIGAGVVGLNAAYRLALRRAGRVVVLDKGGIGDGASSRAAGIITGLLWSATGVAVRRLSLRLFRELSAQLPGYRFADVGCLNLFHAEALDAQRALFPLYQRLGAPHEVLEVGEIRRRWPGLAPRDGLLGIFDPEGGYSEPDELLPALAAGCRDLGVEIREGVTVTGVLERGGRAAGAATDGGDVEADAVVCATHVWTRELFRRLRRALPVKFFVHQRYLTPRLPDLPRLPAVNAHPYGGYLRPAAGGALLAGVEAPERCEHEVASFDFRMAQLTVPDEVRRRARALLPLVPAAGAAPWAEERVGLLCFSADGEPVLGPVGDLPGLFVGTAFHSGGFAYSPAAGQLLAELVVDGRPSIDIAAFSPDRFDVAAAEGFLSTPMTQAEYAASAAVRIPRRF